MGGYLSEPIKDKESSDFDGDRLICGASSMQGWRATQEVSPLFLFRNLLF